MCVAREWWFKSKFRIFGIIEKKYPIHDISLKHVNVYGGCGGGGSVGGGVKTPRMQKT